MCSAIALSCERRSFFESTEGRSDNILSRRRTQTQEKFGEVVRVDVRVETDARGNVIQFYRLNDSVAMAVGKVCTTPISILIPCNFGQL